MSVPTGGFESLHAALQHHIVNSLGWRSLRPLQEAAIGPLRAGSHAILLAPTAGGKTEAASFPILSRMLEEDWRGLSVVYLCPIKALLNNLHVRLSSYAGWFGRRVELWHGDVTDKSKEAIRRDPPDILLTTPESLEVMLTSGRTDRMAMFGSVRVLIVDELHAFAGDDRGWHLLCVTERMQRISGRVVQRIGLSATVGNPAGLLDWFAGHVPGPRVVVAPSAQSAAEPEIRLDHVESLENAAIVISRLHRGEKRLVFVDSRAKVEKLASSLRAHGVQTFVSHSSVSLDERRRAEEAFGQGSDCVIVATSTLELGIDVGDLDRVIQIDAPSSVASFLQRLGRTGRRSGTRRNCLFLTTTDEAFLAVAGLLDLWARGFVEPIVAPSKPYHLLAQQLMALALQTGGFARHEWQQWIGRIPCFEQMGQDADAILDHMLATGILFEDQGRVWFGAEGQRRFGFKNFMELFSIFTSPPLFTVMHGRSELGVVHETTFASMGGGGSVTLLLGGRSWLVRSLDWSHRLAYVEPAPAGGASRWCGSSRGIHFEHAQAIRRVLATGELKAISSQRAVDKLESLRDEFSWVEEGSTVLVRDSDGTLQWWSFAGMRANTMLALALGDYADASTVKDNLALPIASGVTAEQIASRLREVVAAHIQVPVEDEVLDALKFAECMPRQLAVRMLSERASAAPAVVRVANEPLRHLRLR